MGIRLFTFLLSLLLLGLAIDSFLSVARASNGTTSGTKLSAILPWLYAQTDDERVSPRRGSDRRD
jgi:hypothetical protein